MKRLSQGILIYSLARFNKNQSVDIIKLILKQCLTSQKKIIKTC